jgi:hypothetical protein
MFLTCKAMLVYGEDFESDPEYVEGCTEFWCQCTSQGTGPDGEGVTLEDCSDPERGCFREF